METIPINKYKLGTSSIQKTYEGTTQINKMYVGGNLVYRAVPTTTPVPPTPPAPTHANYIRTSTATSTDNYINTGIYPTTDTVFRIVYKPNALIGAAVVGFTGPYESHTTAITPTYASDYDTTYRYFYHRGLDDVTFDFNTSRTYKTITFDSDGYADITVGNNYITDNIAQTTTTGTTQSTITQGVPLYLNVSSDLNFRSLEIWENNVKVYDGYAALVNGVYGVYDSVGDTFTTQTYGGNTMTGSQMTIPLDEVWYDGTWSEPSPLDTTDYFVDASGNKLTYTVLGRPAGTTFGRLKISGNVGGYNGVADASVHYIYLPQGFVYADHPFVEWQYLDKFYGDSPSIQDGGNIFVNLKQGDANYNTVILAARGVSGNITVPEGITKIGSLAFRGSYASSISLPSTLTYIGYYAFQGIAATDVYCYATTPPTVHPSGAFVGITTSATFHYPSGSDYSSFVVPSNWTKVGDL